MAVLLRFRCLLFFFTITFASYSDQNGSGTCRPLWTQFQNHCYRFIGEAKTWEDAEFFCRQFATAHQCGHLVSIHNEEENNFAYELWHSSVISGVDLIPGLEDRIKRATSLWIGLNDRETEGSLSWSDKTDTDFNAWGSGEPNNSNWGGAEPNEDCVHMWKHHSNDYKDKWNDAPCGRLMPFICKMPTE
ncbi:alpha-N-acetylgalactosamine-specific lectin-like [Amphiura filiformis]|uniref:alpha-N-acetylgalactosamine-specific lectin-like n=1 Tax=Amphiura filiformis TaxID=82378 RepID=UPI003B2236FC